MFLLYRRVSACYKTCNERSGNKLKFWKKILQQNARMTSALGLYFFPTDHMICFSCTI